MRLYCETMARKVLPSIRSAVAKGLIESGMNQQAVAKRLGVSQPAVSQYLRDLRGMNNKIFSEKNVSAEIEKICREIMSGSEHVLEKRICEVCRLITNSECGCVQ